MPIVAKTNLPHAEQANDIPIQQRQAVIQLLSINHAAFPEQGIYRPGVIAVPSLPAEEENCRPRKFAYQRISKWYSKVFGHQRYHLTHMAQCRGDLIVGDYGCVYVVRKRKIGDRELLPRVVRWIDGGVDGLDPNWKDASQTPKQLYSVRFQTDFSSE